MRMEIGSPEFPLGIVGAGAMGAGIVQVALANGLHVVLWDAASGTAEKARDAVFARLERSAEKGELAPERLASARELLTLARGPDGFAPCGAVVEAVIEDLEVKHRLFRDLEAVVAEGAILASNTSSLPIGAIARACRVRRRIAGLHFFNPVPLMRLVEVIRAADTGEDVVESLVALGSRLGRTPVVVKDAPGFLVNLGGRAYTTEALHLLHEGVAAPDDIDAVMRECCGFRMGPFELMDLTGIDVNYPVSRIIHDGYMGDPRLGTTPLHAAMREAGRLGRKSGQGFYRYDPAGKRVDAARPEAPASGKPARVILPEAEEGIVALAEAAGVPSIAHDDGTSPIAIAPWGEDCTTASLRLDLDPARTVAVDLSHDTSKRITIMAAPGAAPEAADAVASMLAASGRAVTRIKDSPGFIAQRITAMVANLGCEMAQIGLAHPADIDTAMRLGLNYPAGPLELADRMGLATVYDILFRLHDITGSDRYRPSLWLRRRALLGLPARTPS
jgi:3-hydroxybutyryl-CoA dehydrogenase